MLLVPPLLLPPCLRLGFVAQLTEKMQTSLSTAKGKLTKVGGLLNSDTSAENRSTRRRLAT